MEFAFDSCAHQLGFVRSPTSRAGATYQPKETSKSSVSKAAKRDFLKLAFQIYSRFNFLPTFQLSTNKRNLVGNKNNTQGSSFFELENYSSTFPKLTVSTCVLKQWIQLLLTHFMSAAGRKKSATNAVLTLKTSAL